MPSFLEDWRKINCQRIQQLGTLLLAFSLSLHSLKVNCDLSTQQDLDYFQLGI